MVHKKVDHSPITINSINMDRNNQIGDLELFFLVVQELIQDKIKDGRKGKKLGQDYKMTYKRAQGVLYDLHSYFGMKGCFSFGTCETCEHFGNGVSSTGKLGVCRGQEKNWCDTCSEHSIQGGGFGL